MSWGFEKAGRGIDVAAELGKAAEQATKHMQDGAEKEFVKESTKALTELATQYPENIVIASSSGHGDKHSCQAKVEFRAIYREHPVG